MISPFDPSVTIARQYSNSPTIGQLVNSMHQYFDQSTNFNNFYNSIWNINTAAGYGLDVWGRIVNVPRTLTIPGTPNYFGFAEQGAGAQPLGQAPFYAGVTTTQTYSLADSAYRTLILTKALANISSSSASSINTLLGNLFYGRGRCYVVDQGGMQMMFTFEFALQPFEIAILTQSGVIPRPAGVSAKVMQFDTGSTFGFAEQGSTAQPFNQGVFFNPDIGIIPVSK